MAVYVDDMRARVGRFTLCHMLADSTEELLAMATLIGLDAGRIQKPGTYQEHFDISRSRRRLALRAGAVEIDRVYLGRLLRLRRAAAPPPAAGR
ncbi:DUF4031 domain-containing protein [Oceanicella sp. SM1341]|uniref:DUF4031 domain-containing protein n=1 Tax=Oceanicella sp. SM1341 TaxID=1548889 RepID=UPI000E5146AE|nr:DUF4031 domain-containing protein [Oceanicella sp. SM1341]